MWLQVAEEECIAKRQDCEGPWNGNKGTHLALDSVDAERAFTLHWTCRKPCSFAHGSVARGLLTGRVLSKDAGDLRCMHGLVSSRYAPRGLIMCASYSLCAGCAMIKVRWLSSLKRDSHGGAEGIAQAAPALRAMHGVDCCMHG